MKKDLQLLARNQRMAEWAQRVSECRNSGLTVRSWCEQHEINEKTYYSSETVAASDPLSG